MTYNELIEKIWDIDGDSDAHENALRAVVELHKPDSTGGCNACENWTNEGPYQLPYPCPTIQAIEKALHESSL
jgi:hypothetical protein